MKLKSIVAAGLVAFSAFSANALTFKLGTIGSAALGNSNVGGAFTDTYNFTLADAALVAADATNVSTLIPSFSLTLGEIFGFGASIDGVALALITTSEPLQVGASEQKKVLLTTPAMSLAAGNHTLLVFGTGKSMGTASYAGQISVTSVPEPETYAMMLAGLGALGFMVRRRRND